MSRSRAARGPSLRTNSCSQCARVTLQVENGQIYYSQFYEDSPLDSSCLRPCNEPFCYVNQNLYPILLTPLPGLFANQARDARAGRLPPDYRHAIVYLKDVDPRHMELLLTYMYRGEINVQEHELMSFLAAAKSLQIKGLADGGSNDGNSQQNKSKPPTPISLPTRPLPMAQAKKRPLILAPGAGGESAAAKMMKDEMEENNGEGTSQVQQKANLKFL